MPAQKKRESYLLVPSCVRTNGFGHLKRCAALASGLPGSAVLLPDRSDVKSYGRAELLDLVPELKQSAVVSEPETGSLWDFAVLDLRAASEEEYGKFAGCSRILIGLDDGGSCRKRFPYLIDTLYLPGKYGPPNITASGRAVAEKKRGRSDKILISFGGEDPGRLTEKTLNFLIRGGIDPERITVIRGPLFGRALPGIPGVKILENIKELPRLFIDFGFLLTSFGLTAYEGAGAGLGVLLFNPTKYHRKLAQGAGFVTGDGWSFRKTAAVLNGNGDSLRKAAFRAVEALSGRSLISVLKELSPADDICPCCGTPSGETEARFDFRTYRRCPSCGLVYMILLRPELQSDYGADYFFDQYQSQYGKTYLEDFGSIKETADIRAKTLFGLLGEKTEKPAILDIGCAYGPFLLAAKEKGASPYGLEIGEKAAAYVRDVLGIPVAVGPFPNVTIPAEWNTERFDAVTLWYVIEHFEDLETVLKAVNSLLRPGGILAFSTPSGSGISFRKNRKLFYERSPVDHFTIWSPSKCRRVLSRFGFRIRKKRITGHHPERFFSPDRKNPPILRKTAGFLSVIFRLGDTFEIYAEKIGDTG